MHFDADQHPFFNLTRDLQLVGQAFNTVIIPAGLPALVRQARDAGLRVILDPDLKAAFHSPQGVGPMVQSVITQVRSEPGEIWGIRVADRLNDKLSTDQQLKFLSETAAVFRRELPGVHVFADVSNWELACGIPGQVSCQKYVNTQFRYETNADLLALYHSGYLDGFMLALDVKGHNRTVQLSAWRKARAMFPHPFLLFARNAGLSFPEQSYPGDASTAATGVAGAYRIPFAAGVDGVDLWAWHRLFRGTERTFLNKNGSSNPLWAAMVSEAATLHAQARPANAAA